VVLTAVASAVSIGLNGNLNQAIVIRTFISRGGELWFQAGSGVVAKEQRRL
jgi:anthranilate/para-aminobenzoate synthase component I